MDYELYLTDRPLWLLSVFINFVLTVVLYGAGPFFYWRFKKKTATQKTLLRFCIIYTVLIFIVFRIAGSSGSSSPALLWGVVFYSIFSAKIKSRDKKQNLKNEAPITEEKQDKPEKSFYELEKSAEQVEHQKFGPLDPPKKRKPISKVFILRALTIVLVCCLGGLSIYGAYRTSVLSDQLVKANEWEKKYNSLKSKYDSLLIENQVMESEYDAMADEYLYAIERSGFLMNSIGFIVNGSGYYHTYDCTMFKNADEFWAHNIEYCEYLGYYQCPYCW